MPTRRSPQQVRFLFERACVGHALAVRHVPRSAGVDARAAKDRKGIAGSAPLRRILGRPAWPCVLGSCGRKRHRAVASGSRQLFGWHLVSMGEPIVLACLLAAVLVAWWWPRRARGARLCPSAAGCFSRCKDAEPEPRSSALSSFAGSEAPTSFAIAPQFGRPFSWTVYARTGKHVRAWSVDSWTGYVRSAFAYLDASALPGVEQSRDIPVVHTFLGLSMIPFARVADEGGQRFVLWSDATSCSAEVRCLVWSRGGRKMAPFFRSSGSADSGNSGRYQAFVDVTPANHGVLARA